MDNFSFENKNILTTLQSYLKKQVHLLQRQHSQKKKMYQELQDVLQSYFMVYTTLLHPEGHVTSDQGLQNCYNFIKQVCMMVSRDVQLGTMILLQSELTTTNHKDLAQAMINIVYENLAEKQEYKKPIYLFLRNLMEKILVKITKTNEEEPLNIGQRIIVKIKHYIDIFLKKQEINEYFYDITKPTATQIMSIDLNSSPNSNRNAFISEAFTNSINQESEIEFIDNFQRNIDRNSFCSQRNQPRICSFIKKPDIPLKDLKSQIYTEYCQRLIEQASFAPTSFKIIIKLLYSVLQQHYQKVIHEKVSHFEIKHKIYQLIWYIIKDCYINPMKKIEGDLFMKLQDIQRNGILEQMRLKFELDAKQPKNKMVQNIIVKLLAINEKKYQQICEAYTEMKVSKKFVLPFLVENSPVKEKTQNEKISNEKEKKTENEQTPTIFTRAICMNYKQLYLLLKSLKHCSKFLTATNGSQYPKILNRVNKLYEMSPNLQVLTSRKNGNFTYVLFMEVKLTGILQSDYHKIYVQQYKDNNLKNTLKQVLVQLGDIYHQDRQCYSNGRGFNRKYKQGDLGCYLKAVINEYALQKQGRKIRKQEIMNIPLSCLSENIQNMPTTLIVKIKYLQWMISSIKPQTQQSLLTQMLQQCEQRLNSSVQVYQYAKFTLLRAISNIKNNKHSHEYKKKNQIKSCNQLKNTILIENTRVNLCVTSPQTRQSQKGGGSVQQLKYRMSSANQIIFTDVKHCMHKDNPFSGLQWHSDSPKKLIHVFCSLPQVKNAIATGIDKVGIKFSLYNIIQFLKGQIRKQNQFSAEQLVHFSKHLNYLMLRTLHYYLLEKQSYNQDQLFYMKTLKLSCVKNKYLAIPIQSNLQPIWEICSKYLNGLQNQNTPQLKIKYLKEILETVKIALYGHDNNSVHKKPHRNKHRKDSSVLKSQHGSESTQKTTQNCIERYEEVMMVYIIIRSKPQTLISNINFIETFLPDSKLLSSDGEIIKFMSKAISKIKNEELAQYLTVDLSDIKSENLKESLITTYKQI